MGSSSPSETALSFPFLFLTITAASLAITLSRHSEVENTCVPRFPTVTPALFRFLASTASLSPLFSSPKTVLVAFAVSKADTSKLKRSLTCAGTEGPQDCKNCMWLPDNVARGVREAGEGVGDPLTRSSTRLGLNGHNPVSRHPTRILCSFHGQDSSSCQLRRPNGLGDPARVVHCSCIVDSSHGVFERAKYADIERLGDVGGVCRENHEINGMGDAQRNEPGFDMTAMAIDDKETAGRSGRGCAWLKYALEPIVCEGVV